MQYSALQCIAFLSTIAQSSRAQQSDYLDYPRQRKLFFLTKTFPWKSHVKRQNIYVFCTEICFCETVYGKKKKKKNVTRDMSHVTRDLVKWPVGQWEASKKIEWGGDTQTDTQTDKQTDGHRNSMTESAQWADSVKRRFRQTILANYRILRGHKRWSGTHQ